MRITQYADTPIGILEIAEENGKIVKIGISERKKYNEYIWNVANAESEQGRQISEEIEKLKKQLKEYFDGSRTAFDLEYELCGTVFEKQVWQALINIPYGSTVSYGEIAERIGKPKASRAVGNAVGKNNLLILVPCHRVIRGNGDLGGFSAGIENKVKLQKFEKILD